MGMVFMATLSFQLPGLCCLQELHAIVGIIARNKDSGRPVPIIPPEEMWVLLLTLIM